MKNTFKIKDILNHRPCQEGVDRLKLSLGVEELDAEQELSLNDLKNNSIGDMLWLFEKGIIKIKGQEEAFRNMVADFAESVLPIFEKRYPSDSRPRKAIEACRNMKLSQEELKEIRDSVNDAASDAYVAYAYVAYAYFAYFASDASYAYFAYAASDASYAYVAYAYFAYAASDASYASDLAVAAYAAAASHAAYAYFAYAASDASYAAYVAAEQERTKQRAIVLKYFGV